MSCNNKDLKINGSITETTKINGGILSTIKLNGNILSTIKILGSVVTFITSLSAKMTIRLNVYINAKAVSIKLIRNLFIKNNVKINIRATATKFAKTNIKTNVKINLNATSDKNAKMPINFKHVFGKDAILDTHDDKSLEVLDPETLGFLDFGEGIRATVERGVKSNIANNVEISLIARVFRYLKLEYWDNYQLQNMDNLTLSQIDEQIV